MKARGVKVRVILDKSNEERKYGASAFIGVEGVATYIDAKHETAHNKVMIIDGATVISGSFNFTKQAEKENAENLLIIDAKLKMADGTCGTAPRSARVPDYDRSCGLTQSDERMLCQRKRPSGRMRDAPASP